MVSPVHGDYRRHQAEIPLIALSKFPRPALADTWRTGRDRRFLAISEMVGFKGGHPKPSYHSVTLRSIELLIAIALGCMR
jgi:hypothetical protein